MSKDTRGSGDAGVRLSEDQVAAVAAVVRAVEDGRPISVLVGPAGSGKTTIMGRIIDHFESRGREVVLVCPTGKAASVLSEKTGRAATTIHKAIYGGVSEDGEGLVFSEPRPPCRPGGLVVCDEASMVGESLHADLLVQVRRARGAQILYVGDREQLPPVGEPWGPDFDIPTAALETIHRQAAMSPILGLATAIRTRRGWDGWADGVCEKGPGDPVGWVVDHVSQEMDATLLAYTNQTRRGANTAIRSALGFIAPIVAGDRVVCLFNNDSLGMMNGETAGVVEAEPSRRSTKRYRAPMWNVKLSTGRRVRINEAMIGGRVGDFRRFAERVDAMKGENADDLLHVDYGFCLTVHKSQGSQWDHVGFIADGGYRRLKRRDPDEARRLTYTAVTRAAETLRIFT